MNVESLLVQFETVRQSLNRAKLPFEVNFIPDTSVEVVLYELIKAREQLLNMIREIDPDRFGVKRVTSIQWPEPTIAMLHTCPYCGNPECTSDHK